MKIKYEKGLILAGILIEFRGATKTISNMVIDTGAARTLISQDVVEDIGVNVTTHDAIVTYYGIGGKEHAFRKEVRSEERRVGKEGRECREEGWLEERDKRV